MNSSNDKEIKENSANRMNGRLRRNKSESDVKNDDNGMQADEQASNEEKDDEEKKEKENQGKENKNEGALSESDDDKRIRPRRQVVTNRILSDEKKFVANQTRNHTRKISGKFKYAFEKISF